MEPYVCDVRVGAVAVYRGPKVECISDLEETAYYGRGEMVEKPGQPREWLGIPWYRVVWAHVVCFALNLFDALMDDREGAA
jgi:hypothetical protein